MCFSTAHRRVGRESRGAHNDLVRIIGGTLRGRRLVVPDEGTRPTSDRVREAVFNILAARIDVDGGHVLDLYAGSGALGLEALSRGAATATFVDSARRATIAITENVAALGVAPHVTVLTRPVMGFVQGTPPRRYDLVFLDPPYAIDGQEPESVLAALDDGWLAEDAVVVVERGIRSGTPTWPSGWEVAVSKTYGDTVVDVVYPG